MPAGGVPRVACRRTGRSPSSIRSGRRRSPSTNNEPNGTCAIRTPRSFCMKEALSGGPRSRWRRRGDWEGPVSRSIFGPILPRSRFGVGSRRTGSRYSTWPGRGKAGASEFMLDRCSFFASWSRRRGRLDRRALVGRVEACCSRPAVRWDLIPSRSLRTFLTPQPPCSSRVGGCATICPCRGRWEFWEGWGRKPRRCSFNI
jgi:hypothetical protein